MPPHKTRPAPDQAPLFEQIVAETPARSAIDPEMPLPGFDEEGEFVPVTRIPEAEAVTETNSKSELTATERERQHLLGFKALLGTFGRMNRSENFRNRFEDSPGLVRAYFKPRGLATEERQATSEDTAVTLEAVGRSQVSDMLGLKAVVEAKIITKEQAEAVRNTTYGHYAERLNGIRNKEARAKQLGKVNRRIKKLEGAR